VGITAGSREVPGRNACDRRHAYFIIIIIITIIIIIQIGSGADPLLSSWYGASFPQGEAGHSVLSSVEFKCGDLHCHSPVQLHGFVLN